MTEASPGATLAFGVLLGVTATIAVAWITAPSIAYRITYRVAQRNTVLAPFSTFLAQAAREEVRQETSW